MNLQPILRYYFEAESRQVKNYITWTVALSYKNTKALNGSKKVEQDLFFPLRKLSIARTKKMLTETEVKIQMVKLNFDMTKHMLHEVPLKH